MFRHSALFQSIKNTVLTIDSELYKINETGIFFAPELFTAFCIGKDIFKNRQNIFEKEVYEWNREIKLGNGGPSDISFKTADNNIVIELKLRETGYAYESDIEKLKKLPATDEKFFCALLDTIEGKYDGRCDYIENKFGNQIINIGYYSFQTWNKRDSPKIICNFYLYKIL